MSCCRLAVVMAALIVLGLPPSNSLAADGSVVLQFTNGTMRVKVDGDKDKDWWIQSSTNFTTWTTLTNLGSG